MRWFEGWQDIKVMNIHPPDVMVSGAIEQGVIFG